MSGLLNRYVPCRFPRCWRWANFSRSGASRWSMASVATLAVLPSPLRTDSMSLVVSSTTTLARRSNCHCRFCLGTMMGRFCHWADSLSLSL